MIERRKHPVLHYVDPRPASKIGKVRNALMALLDQHRRDGALPTSVRFLFYELVMQRIITKEGKRPDKIVSEALTDLREDGHVPWDDIVDETREVSDFSGAATVAADWRLSSCRSPRSMARRSPADPDREPLTGWRIARSMPGPPLPHRLDQWPGRRLPAHQGGAAAERRRPRRLSRRP